jgi:uncharacterized protein (TIGR00255 family)
MVNSMTGFGAGMATGDGWTIDAVVRTLNHRYLSVRVRSLQDRPQLQMRVQEIAKKAFQRGQIGVWIDVSRDQEQSETDRFDRRIVQGYLVELRRIVEEHSLSEPPGLGDLIRIGAFQTPIHPDEALWPLIQTALDQALGAARAARATEGQYLAEEFERIGDRLAGLFTQVTARVPEVRTELKQRLKERVASLDLEVNLDSARLETEIALLIERSDIQEEVTRLDAHLKRVSALLKEDRPVGRELDFLSQELLREVNTLGSKARDLEINAVVVDMKVEIERFKEQVQNVE